MHFLREFITRSILSRHSRQMRQRIQAQYDIMELCPIGDCATLVRTPRNYGLERFNEETYYIYNFGSARAVRSESEVT